MNKLELLTKELNEASRIYYTENRQIMSNKEWDAKYDELVSLEHKLGYSLPDSPTKNIGYRVVSHLEKVTHEVPALSLDKTKDREALAAWLSQLPTAISPSGRMTGACRRKDNFCYPE